MYRFHPITVNELERSEALFKFLYFIRDLGIESARVPAVEAWKIHMDLLAELAGNR